MAGSGYILAIASFIYRLTSLWIHLRFHSRLDRIGFAIENSEAMKALLDKNEIDYSIYVSPETKCRIYVNDPDGTQIELVEYNQSYELK